MTDDPNRVRIGDRVTISPRGKKQTWVADFWQDNVHRRVSLRTSNKKVAVERALKLAADLAHGGYHPPPPPVIVRAAVDAYLASLAANDRARRTLVKDTGVLNQFAEYLARHRVTRLGQVTVGHFDRYRAERRDTRHRKTVYNEANILKQLFKWARSRKLIADNPLADVKLDKPPLEPKEGPSLAQVNDLLTAAGEPLQSQLAGLAFTGMRAGELQRLRPEDVDLNGGWVHIRSRPGAETKTRESRKVPIHPRLRAVLERLPANRRSWLFTAGPSKKYPAGDHHINVKRLNEQFTRLVGRLGMPVGRDAGFVAHSLRHFFETFTVNAGIPHRVIDSWLGHRSDKSMAAV
ncbi:tyrosine-type recombinase/integrase [Fimbriiglobus ruber]|uniref:Phage integrase n=1 Tax=Fimbriiglobus ruber TaxID=1908690 RepID=A0A225DIH7_9BACT|nr:tyrosine-type recombinase/integrase [Fimbriiglobus ruber]OWK41240.1 Phage integrase [Fimbriiglobus ruber]